MLKNENTSEQAAENTDIPPGEDDNNETVRKFTQHIKSSNKNQL